MKKFLLPEKANSYKANLHCHTVLSDGQSTPEEVKAAYKERGYSIVAYTDHDILVPHDDLNDDEFLALHGFEVEINEPKQEPFNFIKCCHICFIGIDPDNICQPMWNRGYLFKGAVANADLVSFDETEEPYIRKYSHEGISEIMRIGREKGFFVTYNHPAWSKESYPEYCGYTGMHAVEMFNGGCIRTGYEDYNHHVYDDLLRLGNKIYAIGGDDNHWGYPITTRYADVGWAWTVIMADKLEYSTVTKALLDGSFYSSTGPEIKALWVDEEDVIHVECSPADSVKINYLHRVAQRVMNEDLSPVTKAEFKLRRDYGYFRITVTDKNGRHACTNAYFPEDI